MIGPQWRQRWLADAAKAEIVSRERHHPAMIADGEISAEAAAADLAAWRAIAAMLEVEREKNPLLAVGLEVRWSQLEQAAATAASRIAARKPGSERADALAAIHDWIAAARAFWHPGSSALRSALEPEQGRAA